MFQLLDSPMPEIREVAPNSFIWEMPNALTRYDCNRMIEQFEDSPDEQYQGVVGDGKVKTEVKQSTDLILHHKRQWKWADKILFDSLGYALGELSEIYPIFGGEEMSDTGYQIQRTDPGGFYDWHKDASRVARKRVLVVIWYLNDVPHEAGGATEFRAQDLFIQPEAGKLLFFPPFYTHWHRGCEVLKGKKYIATTWVCYAGVPGE